MTELEADRGFKLRRDAEEARLERLASEFRRDEENLVEEARALGFDIDSVWDFVNADNRHDFLQPTFSGNYDLAHPLLVRHLSVHHHPRTREGIVRALTVKNLSAGAWRALLAQFDGQTDTEYRWLLANALRVGMPRDERRKHPEIEKVFRGGSAA